MASPVNTQLQTQLLAANRAFVCAVKGFLPIFADVKGELICRYTLQREGLKKGMVVDVKLENRETEPFRLTFHSRSELLVYTIATDGTVGQEKHEVKGDLLDERLRLNERAQLLIDFAKDIAVYAIKAKQGHPK